VQKPACSEEFVSQRSLARARFALLYGAVVMLVLLLVLIIIRVPLDIQPAAAVGFPAAMAASVALIFVLLVLVAPSVPRTRVEALEQRLSIVCDPALAVDPRDARILAMNDLAADLFGPREEIVGKTVADISGEAPHQDLQADVQAFAAHEYERLGYYTVRLARGRTRQLPVTGRVGNVFNRDTTVLVFRAEEADRALADFARVQERLMSNISHELRTPLNVVMGFSELMESGTMGELTEKQVDAAREIHEGGTRMLHVVDDVLDIGRARNYGLEPQPEQTDLPALVSRVRDLVLGTARREHVKLEFPEPQELPPVHTDQRTFKQLLYHLVVGAIDRATPGGVVRVTVAPEDESMVVELSNTGKGLSEDDREAIAAPPAEVPTGAEGLPMVLGMPLAAALATRLGTRLEATSAEDGATIFFSLPVSLEERVG